jgi:hypothetical protein
MVYFREIVPSGRSHFCELKKFQAVPVGIFF